MRKITPTTIWFNGQDEQAVFFDLQGQDNFDNACTTYYRLYSASVDEQGVESPAQCLRDGNCIIDGQNYIDWGNQPADNVNDWAYNFVAGQLNITIVNAD